LFTGEDWDNAMSAQDLKVLLLAGADGTFTAEQAARIDGKVIHLEQGIYPFGSAEQPLPVISGETAPFSVTIKGGYRNGGYTQYPDKYHTYLSGASDFHIFKLVGDVTLTLDGVGLTGSRGEGGGKAAVILDGGELILNRATVSNAYNSATAGAIQVNSARLTATESRFFNNVANFAAAVNLGNPDSQCTLTNCEFFNNSSNQTGGAIKVTNGSLSAVSCRFYHNHAEVRGGAVWVAGSKDAESVVFTDCVFEGNSCTSGGGVCWQDGGSSVTFVRCDFKDNFASDGSAGALYVNASNANTNQMTLTDCSFSGNNSVKYNGGSIHVSGSLEGNSVLNCSGCTFDNEFTTASGGMLAMRGEGSPIATFENCHISNCSAGNNSAVVYNYAASGKVYFNSCTFKGNHITKGVYGTEVSLGSKDAFIGMNNCSVNGSHKIGLGATSQECCWYNVDSGKYLFANCTIIGNPVSAGKVLPNFGLVRLNGDDADVHFVNNIIVSIDQAGCSLYGGDTQAALESTGACNRLSPVRSQSEGTFAYVAGEGDVLTSYASSFAGLNWGEYGWVWNGNGSEDLAQTSSVNTMIRDFDPDFHLWLDSVGALGKDIQGKERGETSWPGSYQNN
jgi:predicted outer membrane repeat protein